MSAPNEKGLMFDMESNASGNEPTAYTAHRAIIKGCVCLPCGENTIRVYQDRVSVETQSALMNIPAWLCCRTLSTTNIWFRDSKNIGASNEYCNFLSCQKTLEANPCACFFIQFPCCMPKQFRIWGEQSLATYLDTDVTVINELLKQVATQQQAYKAGKSGPAASAI